MLVLFFHFRFSFPFDGHTVPGYFWYLSQNFIYVNLYFGALIIYIQFFVGSCAYLSAFCKDFALSSEHFDELIVSCVGKEHTNSLDDKLRDIIQFHIDIKE